MKKLPSMASISNLEMAGERVRNYFDHLVSTKRLVRSWKTETFKSDNAVVQGSYARVTDLVVVDACYCGVLEGCRCDKQQSWVGIHCVSTFTYSYISSFFCHWNLWQPPEPYGKNF